MPGTRDNTRCRLETTPMKPGTDHTRGESTVTDRGRCRVIDLATISPWSRVLVTCQRRLLVTGLASGLVVGLVLAGCKHSHVNPDTGVAGMVATDEAGAQGHRIDGATGSDMTSSSNPGGDRSRVDMNSETTQQEDGLPLARITGFSESDDRLVFSVISTGCTTAAHVRPAIERRGDAVVVVTLYQLKRDRCRRMPTTTRIDYLKSDLGIQDEAIEVVNPVEKLPGRHAG